uniref:SdrD B-like domain-containing protein n=1 Tax=Geobacter sp. TaxID=46610 RepID=UPI0027B9FE8F
MMRRLTLLFLALMFFVVSTASAQNFWVGSVFNDTLGVKVPNVMGFDWASSGSGNAQGVGPAGSTLTPGQQFNFRYQSFLFALTDPNGQSINFPGLNSNFEYTVVAILPEEVVSFTTTGSSSTALFKTLAGGQFFIYHDASPNANVPNGFGFDDGDLVASGTIDPNSFSSFTFVPSSNLGIGSAILTGKVTYANPAFLDPAITIVTLRFESTINFPPLDSTTTKYFDGRTGQGNLPTYSAASGDLNLKVDASSKFGESPCTGKIGDFVWHDTNRNGIQDSGEPGIDSITVRLFDAGNTLLATTTTGIGPGGQHGYYLFSNLCQGTYRVEVDPNTLPPGFFPTPNEVGTDRSIDSNGSPSMVTLPANDSTDLTIDFGYQSPCAGIIGNFVWNDLNKNGIQDQGEPGINDVTINLFNGPDNLIMSTTSGPNGFYQFTGLCAGSYTVEVVSATLPPGFTPTTSNAPGSTPENDSNDSPADVTLPTSDSVDNTIDFGYQPPCTGKIGDFVWFDTNRNGIQDSGEPGIDAVTVRLKNSGGTVIATTFTGPNGFYQFTGLCAGSYTVEVDETTLPPGLLPTPKNVPGSTPENDSNGSPAAVTLTTDTSVDMTIDFGYLSPCTGSIGDFVWDDNSQNGIQDGGEPGIPAVRVYLKNPLDNSILATSITNGSGIYTFTGLCQGDYKVEVDVTTLPPGYTASPSLQGNDPAKDSNGSPTNVTLPADDATDTTIDFGYYLQPATIGDKVWNDLNKDGIQDANEPGISGVKVELFTCANVKVAETF